MGQIVVLHEKLVDTTSRMFLPFIDSQDSIENGLLVSALSGQLGFRLLRFSLTVQSPEDPFFAPDTGFRG